MRVIKKISGILFVTVLCVSIILFVNYKYRRTERSGRVVVARYDLYEGDADGGSYHFTFFTGKDSVHEIVPVPSDFKMKVGTFCFAKVKIHDPGDYPIIYYDSIVPKCLLGIQYPICGWRQVPQCDFDNCF